MNTTLMDKARSILNDEGLSRDYWEEVDNTTCYVVNRLTMSALVNKTPYEAWDGKIPSISHPIVFVCDSFMHIPK